MSESSAFIVIRDGEARIYGNAWSTAFLIREVVWGPEALAQWLESGEEFDDNDFYGFEGAVLDLDQKVLTWAGGGDSLAIPKTEAIFDRLLSASWPGFSIRLPELGPKSFADAAGESFAWDEEDEEETNWSEHAFSDRAENVREATGIYEDEDEEDDLDEDDIFGDTSAWITLAEQDRSPRHRRLTEISLDLIHGEEDAIALLRNLPAAEVLPESSVSEGMWIDNDQRQIRYWSTQSNRAVYERLKESWDGWDVQWCQGGYEEHCSLCDVPGEPMSDVQALGTFVPILLSTKKLDASALVSGIGGSIKSTATKAVGCLLLFLSVPILIFGYFMDQMQAAGISIGVLVAVSVIAFKVVEAKIKRRFTETMPRSMMRHQDDDQAPVAGPLDADQRRERLEQLLSAAGLAALSAIEPHFEENEALELLS